jgi:hypothetical protein
MERNNNNNNNNKFQELANEYVLCGSKKQHK